MEFCDRNSSVLREMQIAVHPLLTLLLNSCWRWIHHGLHTLQHP